MRWNSEDKGARKYFRDGRRKWGVSVERFAGNMVDSEMPNWEAWMVF